MQSRLSLSILCGLLLAAAPRALAANTAGSLDSGFGTQGVVLSAVGDEGTLAMALQADQKILTATVADAGGDKASLKLTRFTTAGALDGNFGSSGVATVSIPVDTLSVVRAMLRQTSDSKLLVAGRSIDAFAVLRLTTTGALDTGYGSGGSVKTKVSGDDEILALAQQSTGEAVAVGLADDGLDSDFAIVRYTTAGAPDASFSGDGIATVEFGGNDAARAVAVQSNGAIVVAGSTEGSSSDIAVARLTSAGALDSTFGTGGKVTTSVTTGDDVAYAVLVQPDGKIVVAGEAGEDFVVVRYTDKGVLDSGFGTGGIVRTNVTAGSIDTARALLRQTDDKLVVAGQTSPGRAGDFALVRYTTAGAPDSTFGTSGIVTTSVAATFDEELTSMLLQDDGKLLAAGLSEDGSTTYQAVARYLTGSSASTCGNSTIEGAEECDDGNTTSGDGCSATCTREAACGDADQNGSITASDALRVLKFAVGTPVTCPAFVCDVDSSATVTASDALKVLKKGVGQTVTLACPAP